MRLVLLCALALVCGAAHADPALSVQAAQAHYEAGSTYFEQGDLRRAIVEFRAAQRDDDRPALDRNLGVCYEHLGDAARAVYHFRRYLDRSPASDERAELERRIATLLVHTGRLAVRTSTPDAHVTLDDEPIALPLTEDLVVTGGPHRLVATREGALGHSVEVQIVDGTRTEVAIDPVVPVAAPRRKRHGLAIGLGVAGGAVLIGTAVVLGVVLGTRDQRSPYVGNLGVITVAP